MDEATQNEMRFFTLDEANRTLPLVRRILQDIVDAHAPFQARLRKLQQRLSGPGDAEASETRGLRAAVEADADRINGYIAELHEIGCLFKGVDPGLVDFYAIFEDRPIYLCWQLGEAEIGYWHEVEAGFAGRRPITGEIATELTAGSDATG